VRPIRTFILKIHGWCDLACDHCYIYESADQTWRGKPRTMSAETARRAAIRIDEHAATHGLDTVEIVLHGGEPLLVGYPAMRSLLEMLERTLRSPRTVVLRMQTNGLRLTPQMCELLVRHHVRIGVSLDGDRSANDRHRRFTNGASSYDQVITALGLLRQPRFADAYAGILCTVDIANDPIAVYESLRAQAPPRVDLLLPHATWDHPPVRPTGAPDAYGAWLAAVYHRWRTDGRPFAIRMFDSILATARGGPSSTEHLGLDPADLAVIDTDGSWEQVDSLKAAYEGAPATGLTVHDHSVDDVARHLLVHRGPGGLDGLGDVCRACPLVRQCGGGLFAHRFRTGTGFDNPSAYCDDLKLLITTVNDDAPVFAPAHHDDPLTRLVEDVAVGATRSVIDVFAADAFEFTRALLRSAMRDHRSDADANNAWRLLQTVEQDAPDAAAAVLRHPFVRTWTMITPEERPPGRLAAVAAAAAIRSGATADLRLTGHGGTVHLPGLGTATPPGGDHDTRLAVRAGGFAVTSGSGTVEVATDDIWRPAPGWRPARGLSIGDLHLILEDADPYRDCHTFPATDTLTDAEVDAWTAALHAAWPLITTYAPADAAEIVRVLRTVTPLRPAEPGSRISGTARTAFGDIGIALPDDPDALAVMILHEFQHTKLGALMDEVDLVIPGTEVRIRVAWRTDPRPVDGVLQGMYAHAAMTDYWTARVEAGDPDPGIEAAAVACAAKVREAGARVAAADALTPLGNRFLDVLVERSEAWPR
jgi:uncharacterized protein